MAGEMETQKTTANKAWESSNVLLLLSPNFQTFKEPRNRFQGINSASLRSRAGRDVNPTPTRFPGPMGVKN
jgi:hypothetical protein